MLNITSIRKREEIDITCPDTTPYLNAIIPDVISSVLSLVYLSDIR